MNPRIEKTEIDLSKPILNIHYLFKDADCFGIEWNPINNHCKRCKDLSFCGNVFRKKTLNISIEKLNEKQGRFIDDTDFHCINHNYLLSMIKEKNWIIDDIFDYISTVSNCKSDELVVSWIKLFLKNNNLKSIKGKIIDNGI